jgi:hypothetical protein
MSPAGLSFSRRNPGLELLREPQEALNSGIVLVDDRIREPAALRRLFSEIGCRFHARPRIRVRAGVRATPCSVGETCLSGVSRQQVVADDGVSIARCDVTSSQGFVSWLDRLVLVWRQRQDRLCVVRPSVVALGDLLERPFGGTVAEGFR